jgi:hypothetical protein
MDEPTPTAERTVAYAIAAVGRQRFLSALAEICHSHAVTWEWDLVGVPGMRKVEVVLRGAPDALHAVEREIAGWRKAERAYFSSGGSDSVGF